MSTELKIAHRNTRLTDGEVRARLALIPDKAVADEIYSFGSRMVDRTLERFKNLDTKAAAIGAYSIGIITLLVSSVEEWRLSLMIAAVLAFISAAFAVSSLLLRKTYEFSQDEWLNAKHLSSVEALRGYHIINMWVVIDSHQAACAVKAGRIVIAESLLLVSAFILVVAIVRAWVS
jgi:hypothetical protein